MECMILQFDHFFQVEIQDGHRNATESLKYP